MTSKLLPAFGLMAILATPATAAAITGCASLCGEWRLDPVASDAPDHALDAAFAKFKDPRPRHMRAPAGDDLNSLGQAADEEILGPMVDRPRRKELREELQSMLSQPQQLRLAARDNDVLIAADGHTAQSLTPGEPHARVDRYGTARISVRWRGSQLEISEKYDRRNQQERTYGL
ncbi:MAG TPA: hypothetical protein VN645_02130, partial [Steroidobacteraceae bacterium]|nr:hypothetical protein [Steroidobacteraceae bacterium]